MTEAIDRKETAPSEKHPDELSELELRRLQLIEIRAMLRLDARAPHHVVIARLCELARLAPDLEAVPKRYADLATASPHAKKA